MLILITVWMVVVIVMLVCYLIKLKDLVEKQREELAIKNRVINNLNKNLNIS